MILIKNSYYTPSEFARKQKVSRQYINQLIFKNRIQPPPERIGRFYFINKNSKIIKKLTDDTI